MACLLETLPEAANTPQLQTGYLDVCVKVPLIQGGVDERVRLRAAFY